SACGSGSLSSTTPATDERLRRVATKRLKSHFVSVRSGGGDTRAEHPFSPQPRPARSPSLAVSLSEASRWVNIRSPARPIGSRPERADGRQCDDVGRYRDGDPYRGTPIARRRQPAWS